MELKLFKPFGPSVLKAKIPDEILNKLNKYTDEIIEDNKKKDSLNYGKELVGDVTQEFLLERDFSMKSGWVNFLADCVQQWIKMTMNKKIEKFEIIDSWVVRQFKNEYNPIHYHNGQLSGVGYLQIPKNMSQNKLVKNKKFQTNGTIDFINGQKNFLSKSIYNLNPKLGDLLIFPNYLMHTAYPFNIDGERRSFSFNAKILFKK